MAKNKEEQEAEVAEAEARIKKDAEERARILAHELEGIEKLAREELDMLMSQGPCLCVCVCCVCVCVCVCACIYMYMCVCVCVCFMLIDTCNYIHTDK
jgi:hypothetical protein